MASTTGRDAIEGMDEIRDASEPTPAPEREKADRHAKAEGFESEEAYEDYLHAVAEDAPIEEIIVDVERAASREELERQIEDVRAQIDHLRARLHIIRHQAGSVVEENIRWADASAHAQLGRYPWLKLSAAMAAAFLVGKALQRLPFGSLATALAPVILVVARERGR
ncbi:hypothetical protein GCM10010520_68350 [Rhizobium viscosum]|uniref:Uncharacterized protein YdbL (DUF1318 family) n=1 Tax=Rhizobium viscosum TaxID=1673 RepID=A0ABR9IU01_RHIVS|nr:hypothetical protein [Rhizobium viscosum]MBE1506684.1 uncharacterized protein YdbL (DUF1318 family) [Rhizobium viscosum]